MTTPAWRYPAPAVLAAAWGGNHYSPLLLMYRELDGYSAVEVNLFFACYVVGLAPGFLVAGPLSDRYGRRRLVGVSLALGVAGSVVLALGSTSVPWMCLGRMVCGVSVAGAMVVGTTWIKELSQDDAAPPLRARRASLTLTAGFGLGAGVSGVLAEWGPWPTVTPYAVQVLLSLAAVPMLLRATETRPPSAAAVRERRPLLAGVRVPRGSGRRFGGVVLPMAPWVFGAPSLAFVVAPALVPADAVAHRLAFAALLALLTLGAGAAVQPFVPRVPRPGVAGLALSAVAIVLLAVTASGVPPWLAVVTAVLFGVAYGICIVAGLVEVQAMAGPDALAGLTAIYYSLTYLGFGLPVLLAWLAASASYGALLAGLAAACLACAAAVAVCSRARWQKLDGE